MSGTSHSSSPSSDSHQTHPHPQQVVFDHLAIAVRELAGSIKVFEDMGITFSPEREVVESQGVETAFAPIDQNGHLELLRPLVKGNVIDKFIEKNGEGIHHICFRVPDVEKLTQELRQKGHKLLYDKPVPGARNCRVNFIHPKSTHGVLIEISQTDPGPGTSEGQT